MAQKGVGLIIGSGLSRRATCSGNRGWTSRRLPNCFSRRRRNWPSAEHTGRNGKDSTGMRKTRLLKLAWLVVCGGGAAAAKAEEFPQPSGCGWQIGCAVLP